jgi:hypothetical protein
VQKAVGVLLAQVLRLNRRAHVAIFLNAQISVNPTIGFLCRKYKHKRKGRIQSALFLAH